MKKAFRSGLALFLCLIMALSLIPASAADDIEIIDPEEDPIVIIDPETESEEEQIPPADGLNEIVASGECGDNLTWTLDEEGLLTISGTGAMWDFNSGKLSSFYNQRNRIKYVVIEQGVTTIGSRNFDYCELIEDVNILGSIFSIGQYTFENCYSLTEFSFPNGLAEIQLGAFHNCTSLSNAKLPQSLTAIQSQAFWGCSSLTSISIPDGVHLIGSVAFMDCSSLETITFHGDIPSIGSDAFSNVTATVYYPEGNETYTSETMLDYGGTLTWVSYSVPTIVASGTCGDNLTWTLDDEGTLTVSGTGTMWDFEATEAPWYALRDSIKIVEIADGATSIGNHAFLLCTSIEELYLPGSVAEIRLRAFDQCSALQDFVFPEGLVYIETSAFMNCTSLVNVELPSTLTYLGSSFNRCASLKTVVLPENLTYLGSAFTDCTSLTSVNIPENITVIEAGTFCRTALNNIVIPDQITTIGNYAFEKCSCLENISVGQNVSEIGARAFAECDLREIVLPDSVTTIGIEAFSGCHFMTTAVLGKSIRTIASKAFRDCPKLVGITFLGSAPSSIDYDSFEYVTANVYYPANDSSWTTQVRQNYGGTLTWVAYTDPSRPEIITQPQSVSAVEGSAAHFTVQASGEDLSYQWQYRMSEAGEWTDCTENTANTASLSVTVDLSMNGYQYRCVVSNDAGSVISGTAVLIVNSKPVITSQPESFFTTEGYIATFTVEAEGLDLSYQWQYRESSSGTWKNSNASGAKTATISVEATEEINGFQFRCKVTNAAGAVYSNVATLTVQTAPAISTQPTSKTVAAGTTVKFTVVATGNDLSYQWQYRKSSTGTWYNSSGTGNKTATLTMEATEARDGFQFRCKVTNDVGTTYSNAATLTVVTKPAITTQPTSRTATAGTTVKFTVAATGSDLSYQWQYRKSSTGTWYSSSSTGNKTATLTMEATEARDGFQFRCKISNAAGTTYTQAVTLTVLSKPSITTQPTSRTVNEGTTASFKVVATNADSYQWQYRTSSAGSWYNSSASSATTATLTLEATKARNGFQFRCKISNSTGTVYTNAVTLTVNLKPSITTQPTNKTVDEGITATFKVVATGATSYQWQYRKSSSDSWYNSTADGAKTAVLNVDATAARNGFQFRCKITNDAGTVYSNTVTLTVNLKPVVSTQPTSKTAALGTTVKFKIVATGAESYQWQYRRSSTDTWKNSSSTGAKTSTLSIEATEARDGFQFRCKVTNDVGTTYSSAATLTVIPKPVITTQPTNKTVAEGTTAKFKVVATDADSYQWQYRTSASGTWKDSTSSSAETATLSIKGTAARNGFQFRCKVSNASGDVYTNTVTLTVNPENETVYRALLIGQTYSTIPSAATLRGDKDVARLEALFNDITGAEGGTIQVTSRIDASYSGIQNAISTAFDGADSNDVSIFYYSGHGVSVPDYDTYEDYVGALCTVEPDGIEAYIRFSDLAQMLNAVPGKVVVILDSCHSGGAIYQNGNLTIVPNSTDLQQFCDNAVQAFAEIDDGLPAGDGEIKPNMGELRTSKFYVLTACAYNDTSIETAKLGGGVFTFTFVTGVQDTMRADTNGDGKASLHEIYLWCDGFVRYLVQEEIIGKYQATQEYPQNSTYIVFAKKVAPSAFTGRPIYETVFQGESVAFENKAG